MQFLCDECNKNHQLPDSEFCQVCINAVKECRTCHEELSIFKFERNQRTPRGAVNRRNDCKKCRKKRIGKPLTAAKRKKFEQENPRPIKGDTFECPLCKRIFTVTNPQSVNLDHDKETGEPRGWLCGDCNTSMGRLHDDPSVLARGIIWISSGGESDS